MNKDELISKLCDGDHRDPMASKVTVEWMELVQERVKDELGGE